MKKSLIIISFLIISTTLSAQIRNVSIQNSKAINDTIFNKNIFFLKEFANSRITMNDGSTYSVKANISSIAQAVTMIGEKGDTLGVSMEKDIVVFSGGGITAMKVSGKYHQVLHVNGEVSLAKTRNLDIRDRRPTGAYGGGTHTSSVDQVSHFDGGGVSQLMDLINNEWANGGIIEMEYEYIEELFLISKGRRYVPTRKNFEKLFSKQRSDIATYLKDSNVNFSKKDEVIGLFLYLAYD